MDCIIVKLSFPPRLVIVSEQIVVKSSTCDTLQSLYAHSPRWVFGASGGRVAVEGRIFLPYGLPLHLPNLTVIDPGIASWR